MISSASIAVNEAVDANAQGALETAKRVLHLEARAVAAMAERVGEEFGRAVDLVHRAKGRVVVAGVGKSGHVAKKVAATLTSTGTPAVFLHPVEGLHGDLGLVNPDDVMLLFSKSGNTSELGGVLDFATTYDIPVVAFTGGLDSPLARRAAVTLDCAVTEEACSLDLAPTSSTTAAMAMGDALAVALLERNGFDTEDFAELHPGGSLGRRLRLTVGDVMETEDLPAVSPTSLVREIIGPLAHRRGTLPVVDEQGRVVGVVTAGDLTRLMEGNIDFLDTPTERIMTRNPQLTGSNERGSDAVSTMQKHGIMALPVVDGGTLVGLVHLHDLLRAAAVQ